MKSTLYSFQKNTGLSTLNKQLKDTVSIGDALKKTINFSAIALGTRQLLSTLKSMTDESINFIETVNLFNVSMGKEVEGLNQYYEQAIDFQEELEEKLGVNIEQSMRYQALFNSMTKSMGIGAEYAYLLSENMTKLGYDLASLYNIDPEDAMTKLRAGLAGQTEPLRELGLDITEQSLKPVAESLEITESIRNMSQAEKAILRYIAVLKQAQIAQGDFARTMESPANQLRIFNAQITAFKRNMGNLWQGLLGNILPYINAIMMVINELLKMLAELFGFEIQEQDVNIGASVGAGDLADDLDDANDKAKKLRNQLLGFDEINNITTDNDSGSTSSGGASVGGIDQRLLEALEGYDNLMSSVSNKATEIRDKMLEWLGFERDDEGGWKLKEGLTNFEKILDVVKLIAVALGTWKVSSIITNLLKNLGKLDSKQAFKLSFGITLLITGITAQYSGTEHLLEGDVDIFALLETFLGTSAGAFGIATLLKEFNKGKHAQSLSLGQRLKIGFGVMIGIQGIQVSASGIKEKDLTQQITGALETGVGAGLMTSSKGLQYSLKIGLLVTLATIDIEMAVNIVTWWNEYFDKYRQELYNNKQELNLAEMIHIGLTGVGEGFSEAITNFTSTLTEAWGTTTISREALNSFQDTIDETIKSYKNFKNSIDDTIESSYSEIAVSEELSKQLYDLVDSNGKVKKGYESRVDFIINELNDSFNMELSRDGEIIKKNGEIIDSNVKLQDSIEDTIEKRKKEIEQQVYQDLYKQALEQEINLRMELNKAYDEQARAQEEVNRLQKEGADPITWLTAQSNLEKTTNAVNELRDAYFDAQETTIECDQALSQSMIETTGIVNAEMINQGTVTSETLQAMVQSNTENWSKSYETLNQETQLAMLTQSTTLETWSPVLQEKWKEMADTSSENFLSAISKVNPETQTQILSTITTTENLTPQMITAWTNLSQSSYDEFLKALEKIEPETQEEIIKSITTTQGLTEQTAQAWATLARSSEERYNSALSSLDDDTRTQVQSAVDEINNKRNSAGQAGRELGTTASNNFENGIGDNKTTAGNWIQGFINGIKNSRGNLFSTIWNLGKTIISQFNSSLGEHSPSVLTKKSAEFFIAGFENQIDRDMPNSISQIREYATGLTDEFKNNLEIEKIANEIRVNEKDFSINTNDFIDYGQVNGAITTQSNISIDDNMIDRIGQACYDAFVNAMQTQGIKADIEIKPDKDGIFKAVQASAEEFIMQTGEEPFPSPA